ncbi:hypothetical protein VPHD51_0064 [Vibrio phage D51]
MLFYYKSNWTPTQIKSICQRAGEGKLVRRLYRPYTVKK